MALRLRRVRVAAVAVTALVAGLGAACGPAYGGGPGRVRRHLEPVRLDPLLEDVEWRTFRFFWERANPANGLVPDRWPTPSFSSVAAVGFGLAALPIGAERGWVGRDEAAARVATTLRFFRNAPQGPEPVGTTGYRGFFYHFLDMQSGARWAADVELSSVDTTWLLSGALVCQSYFDRDTAAEREIRELAEALYQGVDWTFMQARPPLVAMGWTPEHGLHALDWRGLDESAMVYLLALGSAAHPVEPSAWGEFTSTYRWLDFHGFEHVNFAPLFGHQYTPMFVDFRGIADSTMRGRGIDYFENSRRATLSQRAHAIANPAGWAAYGKDVWGLTACDGPLDATVTVGGRSRLFFTYAARGAAATEVRDDGTIAPWAALASLPFAPELVIPAAHEMYDRWGQWLYGEYGFYDAFNPTVTFTSPPVQMGRVVPGVGWFDGDWLGIDQGPIVIQIENYRSGLVWRLLRGNPHVVEGLRRAGFSGGWLEGGR